MAATKRMVVLGLVSLVGVAGFAQNTSYNLNSVPIGGVDNSAFGFGSSTVLTTGQGNAALGRRTLTATTTGSQNVAVGADALNTNIAGGGNTAVGFQALTLNTSSNNSAFGFQALQNNSTGSLNVGIGQIALLANTTGNNNTSLGVRTLTANTTGSNNTGIGWTANVSAAALTNATALGNGAVVNASNKVRFGNAAVTVVEGPVMYTVSDGRYKTNISTADVKGLDFINRLRPVVYNFDTRALTELWTRNMTEADRALYLNNDFGPSTAIRQSGFIAQEVEQAAKAAGYNFNGVHAPIDANDNYSLAYGQFVVPLVKAVQEQQQMIVAQQQQIDALQKQVAALAGADASKVNAVDGVKMYPNPSGGLITLSTPALDNATVEVYDMAGQKVYQAALKAGATNHVVDLSAYPRGMYNVTVRAKGQDVSSQKMVLQ